MTDKVTIELPSFFLNQSRWKAYQDCDRIYAWSEIARILPDRGRPPLAVGSSVHKAMVHIHQHQSSPESVVEATEMAVAQFADLMQSSGPQLPGDAQEILDGQATIRRMIPAYFAHWKGHGQVWKPLGMELWFIVEVGEGTNVWLCGTIDNLVTLSGQLWLVDYKTMGKLDMREFLKYEIDVQPTAYIYGGTKQLSLDARKEGKPPVMIRGIIIDGLVKTKEPQFHREIYTRSVDDLRDFEQEFCMKAWEIAAKHAIVQQDRNAYDQFTEKLYQLGGSSWKTCFPKNTQQCFRYGTCSYRDLCVKDTPTRRLAYKVKEDDYVDRARKSHSTRLRLVP